MAVEKYVLPFLGRREVAKVRPADVQRVLDAHAATHAPRTTARMKAVMSRMFATALAWDLCQVNPVSATTTPRALKPKLTIPEPDEVRAIVEAAKDTPYGIAVMLAAVTGARRSEVLALCWDRVDLDLGVVRIERTVERQGGEFVLVENTKSASGKRNIPLPDFAVRRLREHRAAQARLHGLVCDRGDGRPIHPDRFTDAFGRIARSVGVDCRLHDLRHALATRLARSGLHPSETSEILGHASASFTMSTYQHATAETLERTRSAVEAAFGE